MCVTNGLWLLLVAVAALSSACVEAADYPLDSPVDPANGALDFDGDGVENSLDNCPHIENPDQTDSNNDGVGDACDVCGSMQCGLHEDGKDCGRCGSENDSCVQGQCFDIGVEWVLIEGADFEMGSNDGENDEVPIRTVQVASFEIAKTEVTIAQYGQCVITGVCTEPNTGTYCNWGSSGRDEHPVNCVDWEQASAYAAWIGGRLPSEAEWEYAARGGGQAVAYPWGDENATCERAAMNDGGYGCGESRTWPVCLKPAGNTDQGLCDMAGNVGEWAEDWFGSYIDAPSDGSVRTNGGVFRVIRGGSWLGTASSLRAARRYGLDPAIRYFYVGFRPARSRP